MTATQITWPELVWQSEMSGQLAVVLPTGSAPLAGMFRCKPDYEPDFTLACLSNDPRRRCQAIAAAIISARAEMGIL